MKVSRLSGFLLGAALVCSMPVLAGNMMRKSLHLNESVSVHGVTLAPGDYKVEWNQPGPNVQLDILKKGDRIATVPAHIVQQPIENYSDGYGLGPGTGDGNPSLTEVFFSGENFELRIGQSPSSADGSSGASGGSAR